METKQWTTMDKAAWGDGPWQSEPDKLQWEDPDTGLPCLIKRNHGGALCGYVGIPEGHPWYRMDYDDTPLHPHGGLTYASHCQDGPEEATICHIPAPGEPDNVWWVGFDCAHVGDLSPSSESILRSVGFSHHPGWPTETYRSLAYVQAECREMAEEIQEAGSW